jgi:hypothetical protein
MHPSTKRAYERIEEKESEWVEENALRDPTAPDALQAWAAGMPKPETVKPKLQIQPQRSAATMDAATEAPTRVDSEAASLVHRNHADVGRPLCLVDLRDGDAA